jgi:hypothetical protein
MAVAPQIATPPIPFVSTFDRHPPAPANATCLPSGLTARPRPLTAVLSLAPTSLSLLTCTLYLSMTAQMFAAPGTP